ncbi:MAG: thiol:disulfide interchange protein DsbA/DsbL [Proteobacteria bacterium]|jgi:thiol:disulfide interchange protein DsbA|nr:thiol:disulfide interchange protein DsbA/DsbL [Pseudomonadota bacterium]MBT4107386.1 thiol:disulfide interchange protein DsbA/DsbL [Pseudomonadota bacterium]MBT4357141.1 thiol:disulfide interchange protein DsbA/DsbL [Pseudomonadota bacterium]MBT4986901.1 thiol:disulfide interchange protein DsbA/DsbL [Pseudomonadota bacterium]MBT5190545.1 thiol:disulfide interchange protein DsbA/DsbL [Pseudomonadota bacterium]
MKNLFSALSIFLAFTLPSGAQEFKEDVNFFPLLVEQPVRTGDRIEVLEIFWYGCPHCYALEPYLKKWLKNKPEFVEFVQLPAVLNRSWAFDARVFYTFVALGLIDELHEAYFDAIHKDRRRMKKVEQVASWAQEQGVDPQLILDTFNSFGVDSMLANATQMSGRYEADGVPTIIIDGKYRTTVSLAGGHNEIIDLINYLAQRAKSERSD